MHRRSFLQLIGFAATNATLNSAEFLPRPTTFVGGEKFRQVVALAKKGNWASFPIGQRVALFGQALCGTKYVGWTLEIDDFTESPSVNFNGLDCWTFFETALGLARMIVRPKKFYEPQDLLREIEWTRYRGGVCQGQYLDRIHYLDEWYSDNELRGNIKVVTSKIGPTIRLRDRANDEMSLNPKLYRYLRANPNLVPALHEIENKLEQSPFYYIPKSSVAACESRIQNGDIVGIVTNRQHVFCSHVGLALRDAQGACHFMHASLTQKKVLVDQPLHAYLASVKSHAGIIVGRPCEP